MLSPDGPRRTAALTQNPYPSQSGGLPTRAARANTRGREDVFGPRVAGAGCGYGAGVLRRRMHPIASLPGHSIACPLPRPVLAGRRRRLLLRLLSDLVVGRQLS